MSQKLVFIGAGNLATQLSKNLKKNGFDIVQVYSRTKNSAKQLSELLKTNHTTSIKNIFTEADIYFIALKDDAIEQVLSEFKINNKLIVHCSGSLSIKVLEKYSSNFGVFYPLQTFSKNRDVNFQKIPVFIEANTQKNENILFNLALKISDSVSVLNSEKRKYLHIAAVFACNFVNHFYTVASEILKNKEIPFEVLKPLIQETANKILEMDPEKAQTGPAVRFDENIIGDHLNELKNLNHYEELYSLISKSIFEHHKKLE